MKVRMSAFSSSPFSAVICDSSIASDAEAAADFHQLHKQLQCCSGSAVNRLFFSFFFFLFLFFFLDQTLMIVHAFKDAVEQCKPQLSLCCTCVVIA